MTDEQQSNAEQNDRQQAELDSDTTNQQTTEAAEEQNDLPPLAEDFTVTTEAVVEAVLFASDESLTAVRLANIVGTGVKQIRQHIQSLNEKYEKNNNSFRIEQIASGYQMLTISAFNVWLKKLLRARSDSRLTPAALETLAIIAYRQPIIRADIEAIRGVAAGDMLRGLMYKGLVRIVGRAEVLGRPMLYGTTKKFLEAFGLNSLKELPKIEELKKPPN